jgi:hypothetical protein
MSTVEAENPSQDPKRGRRNRLVIYTISALAVIFAVVCVIMASVVGSQTVPTINFYGTNSVVDSVRSSDPPLMAGSELLAKNGQTVFVFSDNLYLISFNNYSPKLLWAASNASFPSTAALFLSNQGTLTVQVLNSENQSEILWSNNFSSTTDTYTLQVSNSAILQIVNSNLSIVWSVPYA